MFSQQKNEFTSVVWGNLVSKVKLNHRSHVREESPAHMWLQQLSGAMFTPGVNMGLWWYEIQYVGEKVNGCIGWVLK